MPDLPPRAASATVDSRGRITIPRAIRGELSLRPGDKVRFVTGDGGWRLEKDIEESPFDKWVGYLKHLEGRTTNEVMEEMRGPGPFDSPFDKWVGFLGPRDQTPDEIVEDMRGR